MSWLLLGSHKLLAVYKERWDRWLGKRKGTPWERSLYEYYKTYAYSTKTKVVNRYVEKIYVSKPATKAHKLIKDDP